MTNLSRKQLLLTLVAAALAVTIIAILAIPSNGTHHIPSVGLPAESTGQYLSPGNQQATSREGEPLGAQAGMRMTGEQPPVQIVASEPMTLYLPSILQGYPPPPPVFGTEMQAITEARGLPLVLNARLHWIRFGVFAWDEIEPARTTPPTYHWEVVREKSLLNAAENGLEVIATIRFTPEWAQKVPGAYCGPVRQDALDEFAQFVAALVSRYGGPPYNVHYWELGNEPDVDPALVHPHSIYGCWGDSNDPYYGGGYYAEMLKVVYPAVKAVDPSARILIGGLLLDCDPTNPPANKDCKPAKFLEGILKAGGGPYFDIVGFHGFPPYNGSLELDEHFPSWDVRGGVVLGKVDFLREVLAAHGVDKPIFHTEGSLTCPESFALYCDPPGPAFYERQADYVVWLYVRNWAADIVGTIWFPFESQAWRHGSLLGPELAPKPAYDALVFLTQELATARYVQPVGQYPALRGYEFAAAGKRIWVLWSPDEVAYPITLPATTQVVYDKYGAVVTPTTGTVSVMSPIYVELQP